MTETSPSLRLLLVEDNFLARFGTRAYVTRQRDVEVVGEAENGVQALQLYLQLRPDVVLCDLRMPELDGVDFIAALLKQVPDARVLVLSHYHGHDDITKALKAGAMGYLTKDTSGDELMLAIRTVASGQRYVPGKVATKLAESLMHPVLNNRELQILERIFEGMSNREIADVLSLTERTTAVYVSNLLEKLGAKSRTEAVRIAIERGLLQVG